MDDGLTRFLSDVDRALWEGKITQDFAGQQVADILTRKKASIKQARLPRGAPDWDTFMQMTWEQIEAGARANTPGFISRSQVTNR